MTPRFPDYVHPNGQPWLATPRPGSDALLASRQARSGAPRGAVKANACRQERGAIARLPGGAPYRMAYPRHAHQFRPDPLPPESRVVRRALIGVVLIVVALAASLVKVS